MMGNGPDETEYDYEYPTLVAVAVSDVEKERSALENVPPNLYESVCVPDLSEFLGGYHSLTGGDQKVASSGTSSGHPPSAVTPTPASNATGYLHDGKYESPICAFNGQLIPGHQNEKPSNSVFCNLFFDCLGRMTAHRDISPREKGVRNYT